MAVLKTNLYKWATKPYAEAEGGLHTDIFRAAILMLEDGHDEPTIFNFLRGAANTVTERTVPDREIHSAIRYAIHRKTVGGAISQKWPKFSPLYRAEVVAKYPDLFLRLAESSSTLPQTPAYFLEFLYAPADLVCVAMSSDSFLTLPRDTIIAADNVGEVEYINPSPMSKPFGTTQEGKTSAHCLDNTGPKRYQVVEFDFGTAQEHSAILYHLGSKLPLVLMVYSGGKSVHGWFRCADYDETYVRDFFMESVHLGADPKMWSKCQFSRMPAGMNNKTKRHQSVAYFNPSLL